MAQIVEQSYRYPPPPPTSNNLSQRQKAQLRRSTNKISRVLGTTPHVVNGFADPIHVDLPLARPRSQQAASFVKPNRQAHARSKTIGERYDPDSYPLSTSRPPQRSLRSSADSTTHEHRRANSARAPVLSVSTPHTRSSLQAPPYNPRPNHRHATILSNIITMHAVSPPPSIAPQESSRNSITDSLYEPQFTIPTEAAMRRQKLKRVTKRLGEGVPLDLLFPDERDDERCESPSSVSCGACTFTIVSGPRSCESGWSGSDTSGTSSSFSSPTSAYSHTSFASTNYDHKDEGTHGKREFHITLPTLPLFRRGRSQSLTAAQGIEHRKNFLDLTSDVTKLRI